MDVELMATLFVMRGLPGSGKTTLARAWVAEDPGHRARINRDDLRTQMHDGEYIEGATERQIVAVRDVAIRALLASGIHVISDDTNLSVGVVQDLQDQASRARADVEIWDLTDVPLDVCLRRNANRFGRARVPEDRIRDMHARYIQQRGEEARS